VNNIANFYSADDVMNAINKLGPYNDVFCLTGEYLGFTCDYCDGEHFEGGGRDAHEPEDFKHNNECPVVKLREVLGGKK